MKSAPPPCPPYCGCLPPRLGYMFSCCLHGAPSAPAPAPSPSDPAHKHKGEEKGKEKGKGAEGAGDEKMAESKRERATRTHAIPLLSEEEISDLARRFADAIPENELSVRAPSSRFPRQAQFR